MRLALIDNLLIERTETGVEVELQPHLGLIALIAALREAGHDGVLYDPKIALHRGELHAAPGIAAAIAERIVALEADAVGFTTLGSNFATTIRIAQALRALRPRVPIVLGGPHATILDRAILDTYPVFDMIVRGEADESIVPFAAALGGDGAFADVPGLTYRSNGEVVRTPDAADIRDLDALPFPAYDAYPIAELDLPHLAVDAGRGCPFHCTFCSTASFFGRRYRLKSAARLAGELERLHAAYGIDRFILNHDLFTVNKAKIREFCAAVDGRGYKWSCSARLDCVDDALLGEMASAGCSGIYYGIETGSPRLQRVVEKNLDLELYHPRIERSLELGMEVTASFITGYPQETRDDQDETLRLLGASLERYGRNLKPQLHLLAPEPGTALHAKYAPALAFDGYRIDFVSPAIEAGDRELAQADPVGFVSHHYYAEGLPRVEHLIVIDGFTSVMHLPRALVLALIEACGSFAELVRVSGAATIASEDAKLHALAAALDARLGAAHPAAEATRYVAALANLRPETAERVVSPESSKPLVLAACAHPLGVMRDGAALLERFEHRESAEDLPRAPRLLLGSRDARAHAIYEIDDATQRLVQSLREPVTLERLGALDDAGLRLRLATLGLLGALSRAEPRTLGSDARRADAEADADGRALHAARA